MDGFQVQLLDHLPLAQSALELFNHVFDPLFLGRVFDDHRGRCYQKDLCFDQLVYLIRDAVAVHHGSGRQSLLDARDHGQLPVAMQNVYAKLGRIPIEVSVALLSGGTVRLLELLPPAWPGVALPASLVALTPIAIDGKKIKNAAKRLKVLRNLPGKMLGGKLLVALSLPSGLAIAMQADPDGERNDLPLVPGLVAQVRALNYQNVLWIADRQFGDLKLWELLTEGQDHFLIRCIRTVGFEPDPTRPAREGLDSRGRRYVQEWGLAGRKTHTHRRYIRRITLFRPGEDDVILATDLLDEQQYPATDLLDGYLRRWGIERMFQQVTEVMELRQLIGSTPRAMIFQSAMCFLLYNQIELLKAYASVDGGKQPEQVSGELLFGDVRKELQTWAYLSQPELTIQLLPQIGQSQRLRTWLAGRLTGIWTDRWLKSPTRKRSAKPPARVAKGDGGHSSVWRIIQAARRQPSRS
jgi:hypothetical protein